MDDQTRRDPKDAIDTKDLPAKEIGKDFAANVKGGADPVNGVKSTKPVDPINGGR